MTEVNSYRSQQRILQLLKINPSLLRQRVVSQSIQQQLKPLIQNNQQQVIKQEQQASQVELREIQIQTDEPDLSNNIEIQCDVLIQDELPDLDQSQFQLEIVKQENGSVIQELENLQIQDQEPDSHDQELEIRSEATSQISRKSKKIKKQQGHTKEELKQFAKSLAESLYGHTEKNKKKLRDDLMPLIMEIFATYVPEKPEKQAKNNKNKQAKGTAFHHYQKEIVAMKRNLWRQPKQTE
ncbi:UNKNOWN [Stylonychia lemnae]|uniref:Uncharacterized protein n=1 Tax=Stylonychia lemnae TaxID=5949 RepID=A0A078AID5_STYLE|nr:UNKNOWN [Stylonychia lemnae]|eukprot:CDW80573.1 UNKNOWN [Stylonychia lemnae]